MNPKKTARRRRLVTGGVIAAGLSVAGTGVAMANAPGSPLVDAFRGSSAQAPAVPVDAPADAPVEVTDAQYEAFWGAGYTVEDLVALAALWQTDTIETKALAGQMLIDGQALPVAPGSTPVAAGDDAATDWSSLPDGYTQEQYEAFWGAGYTVEDLAALSDLWSTDAIETKAQAGQMIIDGQTVPVAPGSTPVAS
jgi:hypothetical protein